LCCLFTVAVLANTSATAATPEEIKASIDAGVNWLVAQQNPDGSWEGCPARTGFAVIKLEERAYELGLDPFGAGYPHKAAIESGLDFIFRNASVVNITNQPAGDPDTDIDGKGVSIGRSTYYTGICMMAIAASRAPDRVVNVPGSQVDAWTYKEVLQDMVDYMAFGQVDIGYDAHGGWGYSDNQGSTDNSNGGYAVLGLAYAQDPECGFNCAIPQFVKNELSLYIDWIQTDGGSDDGGSGYNSPGSWVNILKTGNLVFEMTFVGFPVSEPRLQRALAYLGRRWNDPSQDPGWKGPPPHYQAMYCVMKGLSYAGIDTIDVEGTDVDWYNEFAEAIVSNQEPLGRWPGDYWGDEILATEWALLTLEKVAPPVPEPFGQWVYQSNSFGPMNLDNYVSGTGPFTWTHDLALHVQLQIGPGNVLTVNYDHTWYGEESVKFTVTDATGLSADVYATFTVIGVPVVGDIPDQTTPFQPFDLDDYLLQMKPDDVKWTASSPCPGWTVDIDADNVVTVTAPEGATNPCTITFTATNADPNCPGWWLENHVPPSASDDATFTPQVPMKSFLIEKAEIGWAAGTFAISGNFQLPEGYPKADLDRSAVLGIQIAGAVGTDEVAFMDLGQAWAYMDGGFNGGSGQGINITKFDISWSGLANSFSIKGDLSLPGVGPATLPREAAISLQLGGAPPVVGESLIGFEKQDSVWYYGSAPGKNEPIADNPTGQWDFWLDEPSDFEDPGVWDDPWLGGLPDFEGSGGFEDMWLGDMLLYFEDSGTSEDPWFSELLWPLP